MRSRTVASAVLRRRSRSAGVRTTASSESARACGVGSARSPVSPWAISDLGPPSATATTGSPEAWASRMTWPKVSVRLAKRKASAEA